MLSRLALRGVCSSRCYMALAKPVRLASTTQHDADPKPFNQMPGPKQYPIVGSMFRKRDPDQIKDADRMMRKYGAIYREKLGAMNMVIVSHPDGVQQMFRYEGQYPTRGPVQLIEEIFCRRENSIPTLAAVEGEEWHGSRSRVQKSLLQPKAPARFLSGQAQVADDFIHRMEQLLQINNEIPDFMSELYRYAFEIVCVLCFDKRMGVFDLDMPLDSDAAQLFHSLSGILQALTEAQTPKNIMLLTSRFAARSKIYKDFANAARIHRKITQKFTEEAFSRLDDQNPPRLAHYILREQGLPMKETLMIFASLMEAGVDSTAVSLAWLLYSLARHPDKQRRLQEEIDNAVASFPDASQLPDKAFDKMTYMKACVKESFRLNFPFAGGIPRIIQSDGIILGYQVPKGTMVMPLIKQISRSEEHFPDPLLFIPERWLRSEGKIDVHPFSVLPFGFGPRSCLGRRFAEQEMYLGIFKILQNFNVEWNGEELGYKIKTFVMPDKPLRFTFHKRE